MNLGDGATKRKKKEEKIFCFIHSNEIHPSLFVLVLRLVLLILYAIG